MPSKEVILDSRHIQNNGIVRNGELRELFASKPNLGEVKIISSSTRPLFGMTWHCVAAKVVYSELGPEDFIVLRSQRFEPNRYPTCVSAIYDYHLFAGTAPQWLTFAQRWRDWVYNPDVRLLAMQVINSVRLPMYNILKLSENLKLLPASARERDYQRWLLIAQMILSPDQVENLVHKTTCRGKTQLAVDAMPLRIASMLGWKPVGVPRYKAVPQNLVKLPVTE